MKKKLWEKLEKRKQKIAEMLKNTTRSEIEREKIDNHGEIEEKCNPTKSEKSETLLKTEKSINSEKFGNQKIKKTVIFGIAKKKIEKCRFSTFLFQKRECRICGKSYENCKNKT